jgi:hypothetical protein
VLTLSLPSWKIILAISAAEIQRLAKSPIPRKLVASYNKNTVLVPGGQNRGKFRRRQNEADSFCLAELVRENMDGCSNFELLLSALNDRCEHRGLMSANVLQKDVIPSGEITA